MTSQWWNFLTKRPRRQKNLQEGLFQIASQTCNLLVQVNNTNNITIADNTVNINCNIQQQQRNEDEAVLDMQEIAKHAVATGGLHQEISFKQDSEQLVLLLPSVQKKRSTSQSFAQTARKSVSTLLKPRLGDAIEFPALTNEEESDLWHHGYAIPSGLEGSPSRRWGNKHSWCSPSCIAIFIILVLIVLVVLLPVLNQANEQALYKLNSKFERRLKKSNCSFLNLVESIPYGMNYSNESIRNLNTFDTWMELLNQAEKTVEIASFYWTLRQDDVYPDVSSKEGQTVFDKLLSIGTEKGVEIKIAQNAPNRENPNTDTEFLIKRKAAVVRNLNFMKLIGAGVLHTKFWIVDRKHFYIGSANMDWRSLTQVKELGVVAYNCSCLADDLAKIFEVYWSMGVDDAKIPTQWPSNLQTNYNITNPMDVSLNEEALQVYLSSSPPPFSPRGRTDDAQAITNIVANAEKFVYIAVMDYFPLMIYSHKISLWPVIDNALRAAAIENKVEVRLLISWWNHSRTSEDYFLKSLADITDSYPKVTVSVRRFIVPANEDQQKIPFARVNHNKYMVTDNTAYIGTSNWSGDYFVNTAGVGFVVVDSNYKNSSSLRTHLQSVFERDWNSDYSHPITDN